VSGDELISRTLAAALETPHAGELIATLVESGQDMLTEIDPSDASIGRALSAIRDERGGLVLGLVHEGGFTIGIGEDPVVAAGDTLLIAEAPPAGHRR
jgi:hypothetical protein